MPPPITTISALAGMLAGGVSVSFQVDDTVEDSMSLMTVAQTY